MGVFLTTYKFWDAPRSFTQTSPPPIIKMPPTTVSPEIALVTDINGECNAGTTSGFVLGFFGLVYPCRRLFLSLTESLPLKAMVARETNLVFLPFGGHF